MYNIRDDTVGCPDLGCCKEARLVDSGSSGRARAGAGRLGVAVGTLMAARMATVSRVQVLDVDRRLR